jgi:hypothetical protein
VIMPKRSTRTWRARAARKDLAPVMEDNRRFPVTGPGMLASCLQHEALFRLDYLLQQAHVILLFERAEREDRAENGCRFDAQLPSLAPSPVDESPDAPGRRREV